MDSKAAQKLEENADKTGLDPVVKRQLETSLHAGYEFNAKTAHYGVVWVWVARLLMLGAGLAAIAAVAGALFILISLGPNTPWFLWLGSAVPLGLLFGFFRLMTKTMEKSQNTAMTMATQYTSDIAER